MGVDIGLPDNDSRDVFGRSLNQRPALPWRLADIPFHDIRLSRVRHDEALFFVLAGCSLMESGTDASMNMLGEYFSDRTDLAQWLGGCWRQEELQHGLALRTYVAQVWPEFEWEASFRNFRKECLARRRLGGLEPTPALELMARCVVETSTASLYKSLGDYTDEPVLKKLTGLMRADEVRHYQQFLGHYRRVCAGERNSRWRLVRTLSRRLAEINRGDAECALRNVFRSRYPHYALDSTLYRHISGDARALVARHLPRRMVVKMAIAPLDLPVAAQRCVVPPVSRAIQVLLGAG